MRGGEVKADYPIYKAVDAPDLLAQARRLSPSATLIYRHWYPDNIQTERLHEMATAGVEVAFNRWFAENEGLLRAMPDAYHESYNEVDAPDQYIAFEKYRVEQLANRGYKACVINIAAAHSDKAMWERIARLGLFDAAVKHGALIGEHSYAQTIMSANVGASYWRQDGQWSGGELFPDRVDPATCLTGLRILHSKQIVQAMGYQGLNWIATEFGWDDMSPGVYLPFGIHTSGFNSSRPIWERMGWLAGTNAVDFAIKQFNWWASTTGCAGVVYTIGAGGNPVWEDDNMSGIV